MLLLLLLLLLQVDWFFTREQEASTEALTHRWDPAGSAAVARLEAFLEQVGAGLLLDVCCQHMLIMS